MADSILHEIIILFNDALTLFDGGIYVLEFVPDEQSKKLVKALSTANAVDEITQSGNVLDSEQIKTGIPIKVEIVQFALHQFHFYEDIESLINANEFSVPDQFYVRSEKYFHPTSAKEPLIEAYFKIVELANSILGLAKFVVEGTYLIVYLLQDKSAVALHLNYNLSVLEQYQPDLNDIKDFVFEVEEHSEKKKIYTKELIDFLNQETDETQRLKYLYENFGEFYEKCEAAYAFFLSDFSYSKLKLELESAILDYSKNVRAIINDSQNKLIAIPAAFLVASSQLEFDKAYSLKNALILISSFIFSILIEIFIRNQESSLRIFLDNIASYKTTFNIKNEGSEVKAMKTLKELITNSFEAIDDELDKQRTRLQTIRIINWGMSVFLLVVYIGLFFYNEADCIFVNILHSIAALINKHC